QFADSLIIGSDQVGVLDGNIVCKPHTIDNARKQLRQSSGKAFYFYTGMTVINTKTQQQTTICEPFKVTFRHLTDSEIIVMNWASPCLINLKVMILIH
ncbi:MAG: Maf family protein, partial [Gilliamella sp.]|nr:Maf family protein [Gilliamella sp.]